MRDPAAYSERAERILSQAGEQVTELRAQVLRVMSSYDRAFTAYDIADAISDADGRRVAVMSIYRIIHLFSEYRILSRIECLNAYVMDDDPAASGARAFLVCETCRRTQQLDGKSERLDIACQAADIGFRVRSVMTEIRGECSRHPPSGEGSGNPP